MLTSPVAVAVDSAGDLFIADYHEQPDPRGKRHTHLITTVAGNGSGGYNGDNIQATAAELDSPDGRRGGLRRGPLHRRRRNNRHPRGQRLHAADYYRRRQRHLGYNGDNVQATAAELAYPVGVAVDSAGDIFIVDYGTNRIREVNATTGLITTVAGNGTWGYSGDNGPATAAELVGPRVSRWTAAGTSSSPIDNDRIRKVNLSTGLITTVAGNGTGGYNGDGIQATAAELDDPWRRRGHQPGTSSSPMTATTGSAMLIFPRA